MRSRASRAPARVKVVGAILLVFGGITVIGITVDPSGMTSTEVTWTYVGSAIALSIGLGLLFNQRWAWVFAVVTALGSFVLGVYFGIVGSGDITSPGLDIAALVLIVLPAVLMAALLLSRRSLRWFKQQDLPTTAAAE